MRVKPADELLITVWSEVPEATAIYNLPQVAYAEGTDNTLTANSKILTYIVDKEGYINFPVVGKVKVEGLTVDEVSDLLTERISKDVNNPYVRVQLASFRVNVMGEVNAPGAKWVAKERYSVLDAISDAGDINQYGRRDNMRPTAHVHTIALTWAVATCLRRLTFTCSRTTWCMLSQTTCASRMPSIIKTIATRCR